MPRFRVTPSGRRRQRGQAVLELAIVLPIFLIVVMGIIDFGLALRSYITITNAAREAARSGIVACETAADETAIKQRAVDTSSGLLTLSNVVVNDGTALCSTGPDSGDELKVKVNYTYNLVTPLGGFLSAFSFGSLPSSLTLSSTSTMRIE